MRSLDPADSQPSRSTRRPASSPPTWRPWTRNKASWSSSAPSPVDRTTLPTRSSTRRSASASIASAPRSRAANCVARSRTLRMCSESHWRRLALRSRPVDCTIRVLPDLPAQSTACPRYAPRDSTQTSAERHAKLAVAPTLASVVLRACKPLSCRLHRRVHQPHDARRPRIARFCRRLSAPAQPSRGVRRRFGGYDTGSSSKSSAIQLALNLGHGRTPAQRSSIHRLPTAHHV